MCSTKWNDIWSTNDSDWENIPPKQSLIILDKWFKFAGPGYKSLYLNKSY